MLVNQFRYQRGLQEALVANSNVINTLQIADVTDWGLIEQKLRRVQADATLLNTSDPQVFPFLDMAFIPSNGQQKNYLTARACEEFNIYATDIDQVQSIFEAVEPVIKAYDSNIDIFNAGQRSSGIQNVYKYTFRIFPLLKS